MMILSDIKSKKLRQTVISGTILLLFSVIPVCFAKSATENIVICSDKDVTVHAEKTVLEQLLNELKDKCKLDIYGLDHRNKELVTFASSGDIEEVIKRLLRHLGEKNCAFEYSRIRLSKVVVMPEGKTTAPAPVEMPPEPVQPAPQEMPPPSAQAVRVFKVLDGTQAVSLGLEEGDLIVEYDGLRITDTQQLMEEVKKKTHMGTVEMIVVRKGEILRYVLNGGKIGIQIGSGIVPQEVLEQYGQ